VGACSVTGGKAGFATPLWIPVHAAVTSMAASACTACCCRHQDSAVADCMLLCSGRQQDDQSAQHACVLLLLPLVALIYLLPSAKPAVMRTRMKAPCSAAWGQPWYERVGCVVEGFLCCDVMGSA
jgi:hypothetical protein